MRTVDAKTIVEVVSDLCQQANYFLPEDIKKALNKGQVNEISEVGKDILAQILDNEKVAREKQVPLCQDTGFAVVYIEIGQDVHIINGNIYEAINEGVRVGYREGFLRKSIVSDPLLRKNTEDNTPAVIHTEIVPGDKIKITIAPKGGGSENMSALKMLKPADGVEGVEEFVIEVVKNAGPNPCPPIIVGVGIGGTMEKSCILAKKALLRPIGIKHEKEHIANLEDRLLGRINKLGVGPQGMGGLNTALGVNVEVFAAHIASLPVAVNINCHVGRHATKTI